MERRLFARHAATPIDDASMAFMHAGYEPNDEDLTARAAKLRGKVGCSVAFLAHSERSERAFHMGKG